MTKALSSPAAAVLFAVFLGCCLDAAIKHLGQTHAAVMIAFCRFGFGSAFAAAYWIAAGAPKLTWAMARVHLMRGLVIVVAATTFFYALSKLALVEALALGFLAPLLIPPVALLLLREPMRRESLAAAGLGFVGVLIAISGESASSTPSDDRWLGVAAALVSALAYAFSLTLLRLRSGQDGPVRTTLFGNVIPAVVLAPFALALAPLPAVVDLPWFVLAGFLGSSLWMIMAWAYARAEAQLLAPFEYSAILWSGLIGWAVFNETPGPQTWAGAAVIIAACVWVSRQSAAAPPPPQGAPSS